MRIVFFGTPHFAATILEGLLHHPSVQVAAVITRPDKPQGRSQKSLPPPVKQLALQKLLPVYQPEKASEPGFAELLKGLNPDLFVVAAYAEILRENILNIPRFGCINVHASLLPAYRGAAPIQRCLMDGVKESGVTIMKMALKMDAGDILATKSLPIPLEMTAGELTEELALLGKEALLEVIDQIAQTGKVEGEVQDHSLATFAKKINSQEGEVKWERSCLQVHNQIRAMTPNPGAWCWVVIREEKKRLLLKKTLPDFSVGGLPGEILSQNSSELVIGCGEGSLRLLEVQLEGKKAVEASHFLRGYPVVKF